MRKIECFLLSLKKILIHFWLKLQPSEIRQAITCFWSAQVYLCFRNSLIPHR